MILPQADIFYILMVMIRGGALISMIPFLGGRSIPMQVKVALIAALALFVYPSFSHNIPVPSHYLMLILAGLKELLIGLMMGFAVKILFSIADFAGTLIATETSLMRAESFDPFNQDASNSVSSLLFYMAIMILILSGVHYSILETFVYSYTIVPITAGLPNLQGVESFVRGTGEIFVVGLRMAAPIVAMSFVINMTFSVLGKAVPKMNVFMASFAVKIFAGLSLLFLTTGLLGQYLFQYIQRIPKQMIEFILH